jgi:hypothetical protein
MRRREVPSNGALGRLIWPVGLGFYSMSVDPHRGRLQIWMVSFHYYREDPAILGPTGGPPPWSREKLALQARQVLRSPNKVVQGVPRSLELWIRSLGPLVGRWGFWQVRSTCRGRLRPWSVGTQGRCSHRSTCRRSDRDEVLSKRSEGMAPLRSRRVHGDPKKERNPLQHVRSRTLSSWNAGQKGRIEGKTLILKNRRPDLDQVTKRSFWDDLLLKWTTMEMSGGP